MIGLLLELNKIIIDEDGIRTHMGDPNGLAVHRLKANMNSYIQLQTAAIFFLSSLYLKQGIDSVYVMVGFTCKG